VKEKLWDRLLDTKGNLSCHQVSCEKQVPEKKLMEFKIAQEACLLQLHLQSPPGEVEQDPTAECLRRNCSVGNLLPVTGHLFQEKTLEMLCGTKKRLFAERTIIVKLQRGMTI
jgi:hypothetical protein